ncbi:hypothetical protein JK203_13670 [Gluconobacter cerinus]|uniref:Uncharacterized protein n=2 Tax=Gluconobacter cerinus TaxID=38307 RepID=A0A1B6VPE0_9PROT|nr:hypothetical protein [Gluconobacter cerinus]GBQ94920.1 hypothetical protein AA0229_0085 [Gluconobacter cerinus NRIC 0229]MBS1041882.1 hypothetical protein [Gluconobacter cerinus]MBS1048470.1 hypothetical protein [Gluconobacter cerinus]OAJ69086.1 hypothetical protein A0123_00140 [Gluconobacter cerinus]GLQ64118.1 hypothetical protein GCM10007867_29640 [Gluconobacter cerinus]
MAESEGMGALAGYMLGRASVQQDQFIESWSSRLRRRSGPTFEQLTHELLAQRDTLNSMVANLREKLEHSSRREGALVAELSQARYDYERQQALTKQWQDFGDKSEANYDELKAWAEKAEVSLKQYRALYGPLPDAPKSSS